MKHQFSIRPYKIVARILIAFSVWPTIIAFFGLSKHSSWSEGHHFLESLFYIILLYLFAWVFGEVAQSNEPSTRLRSAASGWKWLFLAYAALGLVISTGAQVMALHHLQPRSFNELMLFLIRNFGPGVLLPNMGFLAITLLGFYLSAMLNRYHLLKSEQELTI